MGHSHAHGHCHHHHHPESKGRLGLVILLNLIITIAEYVGGMLSGSLALISDASHNLSDVLSLMLGYAGEKISEKEGSKEYTFGLKRFEVLIALVNALSLVVIGGFILHEAVERFQNPEVLNLSIMLPVAVIGLLGNLFSIIALFRNKDKNLNMKAAFLHLLYDTISSVAVILATVVIYFTNWLWVDVVISVLIVAMIGWSSYGIIKESFRIFMQRSPSGMDIDLVREEIRNLSYVEDLHNLHMWSINSTESFLSCHILVMEESQNTVDHIIEDINQVLLSKFSIEHSAIQIENKECRNKGMKNVK